MTVGSIIGGGIRLVRTQPHVVAIWAALYLAVTVVSVIAMRPWMTAMAAFQQQAAANTAAGITTAPALATQWLGLIFLIDLMLLVVMAIAFAAVVRAVERPTGDRFAYLRLGMDELRLIGLCVLFVIAAILAETVAILAVFLVGALFALVAGKTATAILVVIFTLALFCGAIYVEVRLSLAGAFTVMRRRIVVRDAWRATRGHFWTLFGAYALLTIVFFGVTIVIFAVTNPQLVSAYASLDPQAIAAAGQEQLARQGAGLSAGLLVQAVAGAILGSVMGAIAFGATATAALELGGAQPPVDELFL